MCQFKGRNLLGLSCIQIVRLYKSQRSLLNKVSNILASIFYFVSFKGVEEFMGDHLNSWYFRVGGNLVKRKRIAHLIRAGKVNICFIQESKLSSLDLNVVSSLWGDVNVEWSESGAVGTTWGFSILWRKDLLKLSFSFRGEGFVGVNAEWMVVNVYSPCQ
ncbi:hypothetical protein KIW84_015105 [Lathyrus oleraceus]|uniref:Uncharacterized protein n=1 Tax=Pisum sativum TaxID=3888 RepID=A0A9D5BPW5_PEA|nr:hypothetical protein KIW84_015105 [Pisum sativum]